MLRKLTVALLLLAALALAALLVLRPPDNDPLTYNLPKRSLLVAEPE